MFVRLLNDELMEYTYDATKAGLSSSVYATSCGFSVKISGFNNKQLLLLRKLLEHVVGLEINADRFDVNKVQYEEGLKNFEVQEPYVQIGSILHNATSEHSWSAEDKLAQLHGLTIDSLRLFVPEMLKSIYLECLFAGNLLVHEVKDLSTTVEEVLVGARAIVPLLPTQHVVPREYKLRKHINYLHETRSKIHSNSCVYVYLQVGMQETRTKVLCELFSHISSAPFFDKLRTKEQLGYIVRTGTTKSISVIGIMARIQSDKPPSVVEGKIETFFDVFEETLTSMTDEQFEEYVEGLAMKKLEKPKRLGIESSKFWNEILTKQYHFKRGEREVEELRRLTKHDMVQFYRQHVAPSSETRRKLLVVVLGKDSVSLTEPTGEDDGVKTKSWHVVDDLLTFKSGLSLHRHVMPYSDVPLVSNIKYNS